MLKQNKRAAAIGMAAVLACAAPGAPAAKPIVKDIYTGDPAALVDNGRVYLYVGHDEASATDTDYRMNEWRVYSSCDMANWTDHGSPVRFSTFAWAGKDAWAGDIVKRGSKYYFYSTVDHKSIAGKAIGVAVSDSPTGPFVDARGSALICGVLTVRLRPRPSAGRVRTQTTCAGCCQASADGASCIGSWRRQACSACPSTPMRWPCRLPRAREMLGSRCWRG